MLAHFYVALCVSLCMFTDGNEHEQKFNETIVSVSTFDEFYDVVAEYLSFDANIIRNEWQSNEILETFDQIAKKYIELVKLTHNEAELNIIKQLSARMNDNTHSKEMPSQSLEENPSMNNSSHCNDAKNDKLPMSFIQEIINQFLKQLMESYCKIFIDILRDGLAQHVAKCGTKKAKEKHLREQRYKKEFAAFFMNAAELKRKYYIELSNNQISNYTRILKLAMMHFGFVDAPALKSNGYMVNFLKQIELRAKDTFILNSKCEQICWICLGKSKEERSAVLDTELLKLVWKVLANIVCGLGIDDIFISVCEDESPNNAHVGSLSENRTRKNYKYSMKLTHLTHWKLSSNETKDRLYVWEENGSFKNPTFTIRRTKIAMDIWRFVNKETIENDSWINNLYHRSEHGESWLNNSYITFYHIYVPSTTDKVVEIMSTLPEINFTHINALPIESTTSRDLFNAFVWFIIFKHVDKISLNFRIIIQKNTEKYEFLLKLFRIRKYNVYLRTKYFRIDENEFTIELKLGSTENASHTNRHKVVNSDLRLFGYIPLYEPILNISLLERIKNFTIKPQFSNMDNESAVKIIRESPLKHLSLLNVDFLKYSSTLQALEERISKNTLKSLKLVVPGDRELFAKIMYVLKDAKLDRLNLLGEVDEGIIKKYIFNGNILGKNLRILRASISKKTKNKILEGKSKIFSDRRKNMRIFNGEKINIDHCYCNLLSEAEDLLNILNAPEDDVHEEPNIKTKMS